MGADNRRGLPPSVPHQLAMLGRPSMSGAAWGHGGATTTGPDATYPPAICQNSRGGGGQSWGGSGRGSGGGVPAGGRGGVKPGSGGGLPGVGGGGLAGAQGGVGWGEGGGFRVRVTELVEPVLVL